MASGDGATVTDVDGNTYIDFAGGIGTLAVGHSPTDVVDAIRTQAEQLIHMCSIVATYEPYVDVCERLNALAPGGHVSLLGQLTGKANNVNIHGLVYKGGTMHGIFVGSRQDFLAMNAFVPQLNMAGLIDDLVPFNEAPRAYERIASGHHFGKVVIMLDQSLR